MDKFHSSLKRPLCALKKKVIHKSFMVTSINLTRGISKQPYIPKKINKSQVVISPVPKVKNLIHNTLPIIIHNNGGGSNYGKLLFEKLYKSLNNYPKQKVQSNNVTIVTWSTQPKDDRNLLQKSLRRLGLECVVLSPCKSINEKIPLFLTLRVTTRYILWLDMFDVVVLSNPMIVIAELLKKQCKILAAGEKNHCPSNIPRDFEYSHSKAPFHYLNSGCIIADWKYLRMILTEEYDLVNNSPGSGDQGIFKILYQKYYPNIKIDDNCNIFQCLYDITEKEVIMVS